MQSDLLREFENNIPEIEIKLGKVEIIPPSSSIKYPYLLSFPPVLSVNDPVRMLLWAHGSMDNTDPMEQAEAVLEKVPYDLLDQTQTVFLTPILPRLRPTKKCTLDSQIMHRDTMLGEYFGDGLELYQRPDIEALKMLAQVRASLNNLGYLVQPQIIIAGSSAGGEFATRFSLLYPELIKAMFISSAGDGYPTAELQGVRMEYPFGIANIDRIEGQRFNLELFRQILTFIYIGGQDTHPDQNSFSYDLNQDQVKIAQLRPIMGDNQVEMTRRYVDYLRSIGMNVNFLLRPDLGHGPDDKVFEEVRRFLKGLE